VVKVALVVLVACSSGRAKAVEDARTATHVEPAATKPTGDAAVAPGGAGDVQIRVEWHDVPAAVRASPGRTACGTARVPAVAPTTTWGIPDAVVVIGAERGKPAADPSSKITLDRCALAPRAMVAGAALAVTTTASEPVHLQFARRYALKDLAAASTEPARALQLPIAGHEVDAPLEAGGVYELGDGSDSAWIVAAAPTAYAGITDATGAAVLRDVPVGKYPVTAWLPPHAGQPARLARGEVTVTAGALAEVTLDLAK
jgi:hypothetical protein